MKKIKIALFLSLSSLLFASGVTIKTNTFKEVVTKTKDDKKVVKWVKPTKAVPKDTIKIVDTITNDTNKTLTNVVVTNPIDKSLLFQKGSIKADTKIKVLFSVDKKSFKDANKLFVVGKDGKKHLATAKDYKAVKFIIEKIAPKSKHKIEFLTKIK